MLWSFNWFSFWCYWDCCWLSLKMWWFGWYCCQLFLKCILKSICLEAVNLLQFGYWYFHGLSGMNGITSMNFVVMECLSECNELYHFNVWLNSTNLIMIFECICNHLNVPQIAKEEEIERNHFSHWHRLTIAIRLHKMGL